MKTLILTVMAFAFSIQAQASCGARDSSKLIGGSNYENQMPNNHSAQVQKPAVRSQQPTSTVRGRR